MSSFPVNKNFRDQEVVDYKTGGTDSFNNPEIVVDTKDKQGCCVIVFSKK